MFETIFVLIGTFVNKKQILQFLEMLKTKYHISYNKIFVYSIDGNYYEYLVTFKALEKEVYLKNKVPNKDGYISLGTIFGYGKEVK